MADRFFTDNPTGNGTSFIGIPAYTGEITYDCYPRVDNAGLPNSPAVTLWQWNTITTTVSGLTEIGRGFNGVIANISGVGLDIPVALASGIEAPATLNGPGYTGNQDEYEEINAPDNDWAKKENLFTEPDGTYILEEGATGFPLILNNLNSTPARYYVDVKFTRVDAAGDPSGILPFEDSIYKFNGSSARQMQSGWYGLGTAFYTNAINSSSHYIQVVGTAVRTEIVSRVSEVLEHPRANKDWVFIFGNGQSLSVGGETTTTDAAHMLPIRDNKTHLSYGNIRPQSGNNSKGGNPSFAFAYEGLRTYSEEPIGTTHVYSMLSELEARDFPDANAHTLTMNEGIGGQTLASAAAYGPLNARLALDTWSENLNTGVTGEQAVITWIQGESDLNTPPATYLTDLRAMHDAYTTQIQTARPAVTGVPMVLDQPGSQPVYWPIASTLFKYYRDNPDAHFATPKYHINSQFAVNPDVDFVHLTPEGYDYQGEYHGRAINDVLYGSGESQVLYCTGAYPEGNTVVTEWNVPSPPLVKDATTIPQATADGIAYRLAGGGLVVPISQTISGNKIIVDIGQPAAIGDSIEFGNNSTSKPGVGAFPIVNFRDSSPDVGATTGLPLYNWAPLDSIEITEAPPTPPAGGGKYRGSLSLGFGIGLTMIRRGGVAAAGSISEFTDEFTEEFT